MNSYRLKISYRGTHYFGWQVQKVERSIQGEFIKALTRMCKSDKIRVMASGRTDAGVHALAQVIRVDIPLKIEPGALMKGLNSLLPLDARVLAIESIDSDFNPIGDSIWKEYHYLFTTKREISPLLVDLVASYPFDLDIEAMRQGLALLCGEHDFSNFYCTGSDVKTTVRTIFEASLTPYKVDFPGLDFECYKITIRGSGFLKQMVRVIVGSLWELGRGKVTLDEFERALNCRVDHKVGPTAAPQGLYLAEVRYNF